MRSSLSDGAGRWRSALGAAPAAPSYHGGRADDRTDPGEPGRSPGATAAAERAGLERALRRPRSATCRRYAAATDENDRLAALNRLYQISVALGSVAWPPAAEVREALRDVAPAPGPAGLGRAPAGRLVRGLPAAADPAVQEQPRALGPVRRQRPRPGAASSTTRRRPSPSGRTALKAVHAALDALQTRNQAAAWVPSLELQAALNDLYNLPNLDVSVDVADALAGLQRRTSSRPGRSTARGTSRRSPPAPRRASA